MTRRTTSKPKINVAACVPAYNEERTIAKVLARASRHVDRLTVVDDGSQDDTRLICEKLGVTVIPHARNLGKGASLRDCFDWARKNEVGVVVTIDADGQHNPDEIPNLIHPIRTGEFDIVIGCRSSRPVRMTRRRRFAQKVLDAFTGVREGEDFVDSQSGFRAYSKAAVSSIETCEWGLGVESEILMKAREAGLRIGQVPIHMSYGLAETRRRNPFVHFTDVVSSISLISLERRPLRTLGLPGSVLVLLGVYGWLDVLATFNATQGLALGHALVSSVVLLTGIFMVIASMILLAVRIAVQDGR